MVSFVVSLAEVGRSSPGRHPSLVYLFSGGTKSPLSCPHAATLPRPGHPESAHNSQVLYNRDSWSSILSAKTWCAIPRRRRSRVPSAEEASRRANNNNSRRTSKTHDASRHESHHGRLAFRIDRRRPGPPSSSPRVPPQRKARKRNERGGHFNGACAYDRRGADDAKSEAFSENC